MEIKDHKIAWFTEGGWSGKVPRNHPNMRNDMAWMHILNTTHYPIWTLPEIKEKYDFGIITVPKTNIDKLMQFPVIEQMRRVCEKIGFMQEGPYWHFQDFSIEEQAWYHNTLTQFDFLLVHNKSDEKYYEGITGLKTFINPTLMITDFVKQSKKKLRDNTIIGGNFVRWYGGFDSYIVASEFEKPIYAPSMGRKQQNEEKLEINHLPYLQWIDWMNELSKFKYAVHLMPTRAAGTFALNCAYLCIPCIGYEGLDTQELCFPELTVKDGDINFARFLARKLKDNKWFYNQISKTARENYYKYFSEQTYLEHWEKIWKQLAL